MCGEIDELEFQLARDLGMTIGRLRVEMTQDEYVAWRAYYVYEHAMTDLELRSKGLR